MYNGLIFLSLFHDFDSVEFNPFVVWGGLHPSEDEMSIILYRLFLSFSEQAHPFIFSNAWIMEGHRCLIIAKL